MRIVVDPTVNVVARADIHGQPLVVVPARPRSTVLDLASAVLGPAELQTLAQHLERPTPPTPHTRHRTP